MSRWLWLSIITWKICWWKACHLFSSSVWNSVIVGWMPESRRNLWVRTRQNGVLQFCHPPKVSSHSLKYGIIFKAELDQIGLFPLCPPSIGVVLHWFWWQNRKARNSKKIWNNCAARSQTERYINGFGISAWVDSVSTTWNHMQQSVSWFQFDIQCVYDLMLIENIGTSPVRFFTTGNGLDWMNCEEYIIDINIVK